MKLSNPEDFIVTKDDKGNTIIKLRKNETEETDNETRDSKTE